MRKSFALCAALAAQASPAPAQEADGLRQLVRQQAAMLEQQQRRIAQLEARLEDVQQAVAAQGRAPGAAAPVAPAPAPAAVPAAATAKAASFDWSKGVPQITSGDGASSVRLRGRMLMDASSSSGSRSASRNLTGTEARSMRLGIEGQHGDLIGYQLEADFADNSVELQGAYLALTPTWHRIHYEISLGNRLTDRSLDGASSSDSIPLMERSVVASATAPRKGSYGMGGMVRALGDGWHASLQADGSPASERGDGNDDFTLTARGHWNPWKTQQSLIHLGAWAYAERFAGDVQSVSRSTRLAGHFNDLIAVRGLPLQEPGHGGAFGLEWLGVHRSAWLSSEYGQRRLTADAGGDRARLNAGTVSAGIYLTGEKPPYSQRTGTWSKPRVLHPVGAEGMGAVELAMRYERLAYDGPGGGQGSAITLGANWYLIDWVRLSLNWIHWQTDNRTGDPAGPDTGNTVTGRVQVSF